MTTERSQPPEDTPSEPEPREPEALASWLALVAIDERIKERWARARAVPEVEP